MRKNYLLLLTVFFAVRSNAQLASERKMDDVYSIAVKQKLKKNGEEKRSDVVLPGDAMLPKQVVSAKMKVGNVNNRNEKNSKKKLPSNGKTIHPVIKKPKRNVISQ
jgi:hypothetical protein